MPRRTPTRLKVLAGTDKPSRQRNQPQYEPISGAKAPAHVARKPAAQAEWNRVTSELEGAGVLTRADLGLLGHYCLVHASVIEAWQGGEAPTAALLTCLRLLAGEFGLSPATRNRVEARPVKLAVNPFEQLLETPTKNKGEEE